MWMIFALMDRIRYCNIMSHILSDRGGVNQIAFVEVGVLDIKRDYGILPTTSSLTKGLLNKSMNLLELVMHWLVGSTIGNTQ